ncbi:MAG TPA: hypothetical protein DCP08_08115, partial [Chloroflexi bacterium]|nr:hypothetical protein [Chloroflexota bacterium]
MHYPDELEKVQAELQQARERRGCSPLGYVAAQAARKLNSCLAVIQGYAQLLQEEDLDDKTKATLLERLTKKPRRL